jgi:hypothetical protein
VGAVRCLADQDEAPIADEIEQRVIVLGYAGHWSRCSVHRIDRFVNQPTHPHNATLSC